MAGLPECHASLAEAAFEHLSEPVLVYGNDLIIRRANRAARGLLCMEPSQLIGRPCHEAFECGACDPECGLKGGLGSAKQSTLLIHAGRGGERLVRLQLGQVSGASGRREAAFAIVTGITEQANPVRPEIVAESLSMRETLRLARRLAASDVMVVLLEGESGVGKDLVARELHYRSLLRAGPFVSINCAAIPPTLLESELFGYEQGAFTDARAVKRGLLELVRYGTLFLDEIGELPLLLQAKLLRVLEERSFRRLGGLQDIPLDARVVAATNRSLSTAVRDGAFRQDLYFRLNVFQLRIPPLRERKGDILALAKFFIDRYNTRFHQNIQGISLEVGQRLLVHDWPGNVRELRNVIERGVLLEGSSVLTAENLPSQFSGGACLETIGAPEAQLTGLADAERQLMREALEKAGWNQSEAARLLGMTRDTMRYRAIKHHLWAPKSRAQILESDPLQNKREVTNESTDPIQTGAGHRTAF